MSDSAQQLDPIARRIFTLALRDNRAGELLACLHDGGTATVSPEGELVLISGDLITQLGEVSR